MSDIDPRVIDIIANAMRVQSGQNRPSFSSAAEQCAEVLADRGLLRSPEESQAERLGTLVLRWLDQGDEVLLRDRSGARRKVTRADAT